jgi:putative Holliday junction resolvase
MNDMRILGLDHGTKRIGIAVSDPMGWTAQGVTVLERTTNEKDLARIAEIVEEKGVERVVVGLPVNMDGSIGPKAKEVLAFVERLAASLGLPVETVDERLTTSAAQRSLIEGGMSRRKRRGRVDRIAAQLILQTYLDRRPSPPGEGVDP